MDFLLHLVEYNLVVRIALGLAEDSGEEQLIEIAYFLDIREEGERLFPVDDPPAQESSLEVGGDSAEVADVAFLSLDQLPDDVLAGEEGLGQFAHLVARPLPAEPGLQPDYFFNLPFLHPI